MLRVAYRYSKSPTSGFIKCFIDTKASQCSVYKRALLDTGRSSYLVNDSVATLSLATQV